MKTIGFGTRQIGGPPSYKPFEEDKGREILEYAYEKGVRLFDTAPVYGLGQSERLIGEVFKDKRQEIQIVTKFGILWNDVNKTFLECTAKSIEKEIELSLKRLQTNYIDTYLLHIPNPLMDIDGIIHTLNKLKKAGTIKSYGVCNTYGEQLIKFLGAESSEVEFVEDFYNLIERKAETLIFPHLRDKQKFIAYSPLFRGVLTETPIKSLLEKNEDGINRLIKNQSLPSIIKKKQLYEEVARREGIPIEKVALNFLESKKQVDTILFGTTKKEHIDFFLSLTQA